MNQKKQGHRAKLLKEISKKNLKEESEIGLKDQYEVIRKDLIKLKIDLQKGWAIARETWGRKAPLSLQRKSRA
jgi:hypothetical protein